MASQILYFTAHSVVGTGFHRNQDGMRDTLDFFNASEATAQAIALRRGLQYVVVCQRWPEIPGPGGSAADSFARGAAWSWLQPLSPPEAPLQILKINLRAEN